MTGKPVYIFEFAQMEPNGCGGHPNLRDHRKMAEQLIPFLGKLFDNQKSTPNENQLNNCCCHGNANKPNVF